MVDMQKAYAQHMKDIQHLYFYKINRLVLPFVGEPSFYPIQTRLHWGKQDKQNFTKSHSEAKYNLPKMTKKLLQGLKFLCLD